MCLSGSFQSAPIRPHCRTIRHVVKRLKRRSVSLAKSKIAAAANPALIATQHLCASWEFFAGAGLCSQDALRETVRFDIIKQKVAACKNARRLREMSHERQRIDDIVDIRT